MQQIELFDKLKILHKSQIHIYSSKVFEDLNAEQSLSNSEIHQNRVQYFLIISTRDKTKKGYLFMSQNNRNIEIKILIS